MINRTGCSGIELTTSIEPVRHGWILDWIAASLKYSAMISARLRLASVLWLTSALMLHLVLCFYSAEKAFSDESLATRQAELKQLRSRIESLAAELESDRTQRDRELEALRQSEREIANLDKKLSKTTNQLEQLSSQLQELRQQHAEQQEHLQKQRDHFSRLVRTTYLMGRQEYLKLLLNQEDPSKLGRAMTYYQYLARARASNIEEINQTLNKVKELETSIRAKTEYLESLRNAQAEDQEQWNLQRRERSEILAKLERRLSDQSQEMARLREDEQQLQRLIVKLRAYVDGLKTKIPGNARFGDMKGKLELPSKGQITAQFGQPRSMGGVNWDGIFVAAPEGQPVRAVFPGQVIFADWFRGFGLLLILDHGEGYMTLYSHNKTLYKTLGDSVEAGEFVAEVGATGGLRESGLYFELRHNGQPRDPLLWCKLN